MSPRQALGDLLAIAAVIVIPQLSVLILGVSDALDEANLPPNRVLLANALNWAFVAGAAVYLTYRSGQPLTSIGLRRAQFWPTIGLGAAGVLAMYVAVIFTAGLAALLTGASRETMTAPAREIHSMFGPPSWMMIFLVASTAGLFEEIIFRGFMLTRLRVLTGQWWTAVAAGMVIFAVPHIWQGLWAVMLILPVSLVLSLLFLYSRNLAPAVLAHFLFNFAQLSALRVLYTVPEFRRLIESTGAA